MLPFAMFFHLLWTCFYWFSVCCWHQWCLNSVLRLEIEVSERAFILALRFEVFQFILNFISVRFVLHCVCFFSFSHPFFLANNASACAILLLMTCFIFWLFLTRCSGKQRLTYLVFWQVNAFAFIQVLVYCLACGLAYIWQWLLVLFI